MSAKIKEKREKRATLVAQARALAEKAKTENRDRNAQETEQFDQMMDESVRLAQEIEGLERAESRSRRLEEAERHLGESAGRRTDPAQPERPAGPGRSAGSE